MHHIQRHILDLLITNRSRRYSQLRPARIEPNQFVYHLKQLIGDGLVAKCDEGYELTAKGRSYADKLGPGSFDVAWDTAPRDVIFLALRNKAGEWLLVRRARQPTIDKIGFIATDVTLGESLAQTARRFALTEYDIDAEFEYAGSGTVTLYRADALESYVVFHFMIAEHDSVITDSALAWYPSAELGQDDVIPSTLPLLEALQAGGSRGDFIELTYTLA